MSSSIAEFEQCQDSIFSKFFIYLLPPQIYKDTGSLADREERGARARDIQNNITTLILLAPLQSFIYPTFTLLSSWIPILKYDSWLNLTVNVSLLFCWNGIIYIIFFDMVLRNIDSETIYNLVDLCGSNNSLLQFN